MEVTMRWKGITPEAVARQIDAAGVAGALAADKALDAQADLGVAMMKRNSSGRPGPNKVTGDHIRSIGKRREGNKRIIGSTSPQARRLDQGFWNKTDRLGRTFRQPAYPWFSPARRILERTAPVAVLTAVRATLKVGR